MAHAGQGIARGDSPMDSAADSDRGSASRSALRCTASRVLRWLGHRAHALCAVALLLLFTLLLCVTPLAHAKGKPAGKPQNAQPAAAQPTQITHLGKAAQGNGTLVIAQGSVGLLQATLSPPPTAPGVLTLSSSRPESASVPATIAYAAGQTQVAIPVNAERKGHADISASLGGASRSAKVNVVPAPSRLISLAPAQLSLVPGASATLQITLSPRQPGSALTLQLLSSDPAKVYVPASVTIAEGQASASVELRALAEGTVRITASLAGGGPTSFASAQVQVSTAPLSVVGLHPPTSSVEQGAQTTLSVQLSAAAPTPTTVALAARTEGVLQLPSSVTVPSGHTQASFAVQGLAAGQTLVVAALTGPNTTSSAEAAVQVTPLPARVAAIEPAQSQLAVGAQASLSLRLNAAQPQDTVVQLRIEPAGVAQVPAELIVSAGQIEAPLPVTGIAPGQAELLAQLNGSTRRATLSVVPAPIRLQALLPSPLGIQAGASAELTVRLDATTPEPLTIALSSSNTSIAQLPPALTLPAGAREASVVVSGLGAGQADITASLTHNGVSSSASTNVRVAEPPPRLAGIEPSVLDVPLGASAQLHVQLERAPLQPTLISVHNAHPATVQVPEQVTVPAGALSVALPVLSLQQGSAAISASLNSSLNSSLSGSSAAATVNVVAPQLVAISVSPATLELGALQSAPLQAQGSYSDASSRDISADAATTWRSEDSAIASVASVNTGGQVSAQVSAHQAGQTTITASQTPPALQGQATPQPVQGSASVVVGAAGALSLTAERSSLAVGQTLPVVLALPYPQAQPVSVQLITSAGLQAPASVTIAAGQSSTSIHLTASTAGAASLSAAAAAPHSAFGPAQLALAITPAAPQGPVISAVEPNAAAPGDRVRLIGSGFDPQASGNSVVFSGNASAPVPAIVSAASASELSVQVPAQADSGPISVTTASGTGLSPSFIVHREQAFELQASPAQLSVIAGSRASASLSLANSGTRPFEGLARLSIQNLPAGISARFEPEQLNPSQAGSLILSAAGDASPGSHTLTVRAQATLDGLPWVRERQLSLQVLASENLTGVQGRFITPQGQGIAGVIVRENDTTNQTVSDAAGNFRLVGLAAGSTTLRFDATPAHSLYPIWPYTLSLQAGELRSLEPWTINPPPADERFTPIANAATDQAITDARYPGFAVTLPAGVTITGWDGVHKTRIAIERLTPDKLPVSAPPFAMKEAYQLYFGTPMGGIPSAPIPVTLPNVANQEPGEKVDIWFFDGSPMGGSGEWKIAGQGTVSADGQSVQSDPGAGLTRFCGVCGLVSLHCPPVAKPVETPPMSCPVTQGNPVDLFSGIELGSIGGPQCGGLTPLSSGLSHNPIDAYQNRAGTLMSFGWGWTFEHDIGFLPFAGPQKRLVMPGGQLIDFVQDLAQPSEYRPLNDPRHAGSVAREVSAGVWEITRAGGEVWRFEPFAGISGLIRGGAPMFLTRISDASGNATVLNRQSNGRLQSVQGSGARSLTLSYGANGFVDQLSDHSGRRLSLQYTSGEQPRIAAVTDAAGRRTEYDYQSPPIYTNPNGQVACASDLPAGEPQYIRRIRHPHSSQPTDNLISTERVLKQTSSSGETRHFAYQRVGACVVKVADEQARTWAYSCRAGQPISSAVRGLSAGTGAIAPEAITSSAGTCPEVESEATHAQGWRFYGGTNVQTTVTHPDGTQTRTSFNARGLPVQETDAAGQSTRHQYDAKNQRTQTTDPLGRTTTHEYDEHGNRIASTDALGQRVETVYEAQFNQPTRSTRFLLGVPSQQGGLQLSYTPLSSSYTHDSKGRLTQVLDATGIGAQMAYDDKGQLSRITLPAKTSASTLPVISDGQASTIAKADRSIALAYNAAGDLIKITDALNHSTSPSTDTLGRTSGLTDALGYTSTQSYNDLDQPTEAKNPLGHSTRLEYDSAGRVTSVVNELGVAIERYSYDNLGRVIEVIDALNQKTLIGYDASNRVSQITDRKGQPTTLNYNERGQFSRIERSDQSIDITHDAVGRISEVRDASSVNRYRYDAADRLIETQSTTAAGTHTLAYEFDSLNRVKTRTLSGTGIAAAEVTSYTWDHADRLLSHTTSIGSSPHKTEYEYDAAARLAARHVQAGSDGRLTQRYGYDQAERLAQIRYLRNEGQSGEQLIEQIDYQYDAKGQRIGKTTLNGHGTGKQDTPFEATYDAANRMTAITINAGGTAKSYTLSHDANGNLTSKQNTADSSDKTSYSWDSNNRLIGIEQPGLQASFTYDAYGRRIQSSISEGGTTRTVQYLYEGQQALGEIREKSLSHRLLTGLALDETIARMAIDAQGNVNPAQSRLFMTDALSSVIAQINADDSATLASSYAYSPYGESQTIGVDATSNPVQYTSRENDGTRLIYHRARYRDPILGGWLSEDPAGFVDGVNKRGYVGGDPVSLTDPTGQFAFAGAGLGAVANLAWQLWRSNGNWSCVDVGEVVSWAAIGSGVGGIAGSAARLGFRAELGRWGSRGSWSNSAKYRVPHFHLGNAPGLARHHLPYQGGQWAKNFGSLASRGKLGNDAFGLTDLGLGFGTAAAGGAIAALSETCTCE